MVKNVLVATDLGPTSAATVDYARTVASALSARLWIVHVVDDLAAGTLSAPELAMTLGCQQTALEKAASRRLQAIAVTGATGRSVTTTVLTSHHPAAALLAYAQDAHADLIVAGRHAQRDGIDLFMGTVAQQLVRQATCPVLTLCHAETIRPARAPAAT